MSKNGEKSKVHSYLANVISKRRIMSALALLALLLYSSLRPGGQNIVQAMGRSVDAVKSYLGIDAVPAKPRVEVPYDIEVEINTQNSVDAGSSPWRLDPVYVAQVFVSLEMSPGGIEGDYPIRYDDLSIISDDGVRAIIEVNDPDSPISRVYLERLVRQDSTGIWTVIGYDPAQKG